MLPPGWFYTFVAVFVVIMAVALLMQFAMLGGMFIAIRRLQQKIDPIIGEQIPPILESAKEMMKDAQVQVDRLSTTLDRWQEIARADATKVDRVVTEATDRARLQVVRIDEMVSGALNGVERTAHRISRTGRAIKKVVTAPFRLIAGAAYGIGTGARVLVRRRRVVAPVEPITVREIEEEEIRLRRAG